MINKSQNDTQTKEGIWRILDVLQWGTDYLTRHGISQPRLSMEWMLSKILQVKRLDLYLQFERPLNAPELAQLKGLVQKRREHVPLQYLLGEWDFFGLSLGVNEHVLIPRPETEILVESLLNHLQKCDKNSFTCGLDLGTGSGNIAIAMLTHRADSRCVAVDRCAKALEEARANAQRHGVTDRMEFRQGDWFEALPRETAGSFDWIVSNPPYIAKEQWGKLPQEICRYEPPEALWGGEGGLDFYRIIVAGAPAYLKSGGWLALEMGDGQSQILQNLVQADGKLAFVETVKDLGGIERVILAQRI